jgi:hypothetical protein
LIFFTDENFVYQGAKLLEVFDTTHEIRALIDCLDRGTSDTVWMNHIAQWKEPTVALCGDGRILKNKVELATLKSCKLMFVHLSAGWTNIDWPTFAWKIIKVWPEIVRNVERARYPTVFEVKPGNLKVQQVGLVANL